MADDGLTPARKEALRTALRAHPEQVRESNVTSFEHGYVYWQSARWMIDAGIAYYPSGSTMLALTPNGLDYARYLFPAMS